ncbi:HTH-type transcriptional regulator SyrM 1 [compost metagenome]
MQRLGETAPGIELTIQPLRPKDDLYLLKEGKLDLVIWNEKEAPTSFHARKLFSDRLKSVTRIDHPQINGSLSLEQFRNAKHLRVSSNHGAVKEAIDGLYERYAIRCNTALTVPHFLLAHVLVAQTDMIGMIAELTARRIAKEIPLQLFDPPVEVEGFTVSQVWHERQHGSPAHKWLRSEIAAVGEEITEELAQYRRQAAEARSASSVGA